jgi:hypothetical protein
MRLEINTYEELEKFAKAFAHNHLQLLIVLGSPGLQKSTVIRNVMEGSARWIEGNISAFRLYTELYKFVNQPFVIDDVDQLYTDKQAIKLLKSLCNTEESKHIFWMTASKQLEENKIPNEFNTHSRICIIANEWKTLSKNVGALEDRGITVDFNPSKDEIHKRVRSWFKDDEIYEFVGKHLTMIPSLSMRDYVNASYAKNANIDWKTTLLANWCSDKKLYLVQTLQNMQFSSEKDRIEFFIAAGYGSRATYFRLKNLLQNNTT